MLRRVRREIEGPIGGTRHYSEAATGGGASGNPSIGAGGGDFEGVPAARHSQLLRYIINPSDGACLCSLLCVIPSPSPPQKKTPPRTVFNHLTASLALDHFAFCFKFCIGISMLKMGLGFKRVQVFAISLSALLSAPWILTCTVALFFSLVLS